MSRFRFRLFVSEVVLFVESRGAVSRLRYNRGLGRLTDSPRVVVWHRDDVSTCH
jgi:hypothetical protein